MRIPRLPIPIVAAALALGAGFAGAFAPGGAFAAAPDAPPAPSRPQPTPAAPSSEAPAPADAKGAADKGLTIELHLGVPDYAYIGQPLAELVKTFPGAQVTPFAGQDDAVTVKVPGAGLSFIAVGDPDDLKVASVGFNLDGVYEGIAEGRFRTGKGIGKGSTVNDLLEAYGPPVEIVRDRSRGRPRSDGLPDDPAIPRQYQYAREDGAVKTNFVVQGHMVRRVVINELAPLDAHILKGRPKR